MKGIGVKEWERLVKMGGKGKDWMFKCIRKLKEDIKKEWNEIKLDKEECGGIGILRNVKKMRENVMMKRKLVRKKDDRRKIRKIGKKESKRFDRIFEKRKKERKRKEIKEKEKGMVNERKKSLGLKKIERGGDEEEKDIIINIGRN